MSPIVHFVHLVPSGGQFSGDARCVFEFCRRTGVIGVGWAVDENFPSTDDFSLYESQCCKVHGGIDSSLKTMRDMKKGDLAWIRDPDYRFYLTEVRGRWRYENTHLNRYFDIVNTRKVDTWMISEFDVPKEITTTSYRRAAQRVLNADAIAKTVALSSGLYVEEALRS